MRVHLQADTITIILKDTSAAWLPLYDYTTLHMIEGKQAEAISQGCAVRFSGTKNRLTQIRSLIRNIKHDVTRGMCRRIWFINISLQESLCRG